MASLTIAILLPMLIAAAVRLTGSIVSRRSVYHQSWNTDDRTSKEESKGNIKVAVNCENCPVFILWVSADDGNHKLLGYHRLISRAA